MPKSSQLNKDQLKAINHIKGPLLIIAGAGAGKTRVITERIAKLVLNGVSPSNILAITFTNKAANEMKERVHNILNKLSTGGRQYAEVLGSPHVSTFHSLGVYILRVNSKLLNRTKNFSILDRNDSIKFVKQGMMELGYNSKQIEPRKILSIISKSKSLYMCIFIV